MTTISGLLLELKSFVTVDAATLKKAKASKINDHNDVNFAALYDGWAEGMYDEDPDLLVSEISNLLN